MLIGLCIANMWSSTTSETLDKQLTTHPAAERGHFNLQEMMKMYAKHQRGLLKAFAVKISQNLFNRERLDRFSDKWGLQRATAAGEMVNAALEICELEPERDPYELFFEVREYFIQKKMQQLIDATDANNHRSA